MHNQIMSRYAWPAAARKGVAGNQNAQPKITSASSHTRTVPHTPQPHTPLSNAACQQFNQISLNRVKRANAQAKIVITKPGKMQLLNTSPIWLAININERVSSRQCDARMCSARVC